MSKADVRYAIYHMIGNVFFVIVFLIFLDAALSAMKLIVLSKLIENSVLIIPKIILALTIFGLGWLIASRSSTAIAHALIKENIPHSSLIARFAKFLFITFFFAVALIELEIATTIVVIAFTTVFVSIGTISIILVAGNKNILKDFFNSGK